MSDEKSTEKADKKAVTDRGETPSAMEPMLPSESSKAYEEITDLALALTKHSTDLRSRLPKGVVEALADLVRAMNCYYSNLIEGHDTHPVDIERALRDDYSSDPKKRDLQKEARTHIEVQAWIDAGGLAEHPTLSEAALDIHKRFCERLPEDLLWVENPETEERIRIIPGELRNRDVRVGQHIAISPGAVPRFLDRFDQAYSKLGQTKRIMSAAASHHRLLWLHPFLDGNGRVARLLSYGILRDALDTGGIWSVARGLARNEADYKRQLSAGDSPRRGDRDGRGNLSEAALAEFVKFFLVTCIDQVQFMQSLVEPEKLRERIIDWVNRQKDLPPRSDLVLEAILYRGELPRADVGKLLQATDRTARRVTSSLVEKGVLTSASPKAPFKLAFPAALAHEWMPGLFPEKKD
ncbi:Fic family protein [Hyphomonadaceae bacterium ML37]|nr:Fic family protein [Hyphomonadaceae bacterium ML37]